VLWKEGSLGRAADPYDDAIGTGNLFGETPHMLSAAHGINRAFDDETISKDSECQVSGFKSCL
jgi:hypothetical protein